MDTLFTWLIGAIVLGFFIFRYWRGHKRSDAAAREAADRAACSPMGHEHNIHISIWTPALGAALV